MLERPHCVENYGRIFRNSEGFLGLSRFDIILNTHDIILDLRKPHIPPLCM